MTEGLIKNLIFDLGGVIINLDMSLSFQKFAKLGNISLEQMNQMAENEPLFNKYEKGLITSAQFRTGICALLNRDIPDAQIDIAWNAMLLDIPLERLQFIERLKPHYKLLVLSNTNEIHITEFIKRMDTVYGAKKYDALFDDIYYSHLVNMRKPAAEIYQFVLQENNIIAQETLYLEDNRENIESSKKLGFMTYEVPTNQLDLNFLENELL